MRIFKRKQKKDKIYLKGNNIIYLPNIKSEKYFTKIGETYEVLKGDEDSLYGWIIEISLLGSDHYIRHWNRKVYYSRSDALDAINQNFDSNWKYKITPLYKLEQSKMRSLIINKILENEID